ncbi:hypothetical protein, partial [Meridianimarinicoccus zhengii]|uniref:hypothetical protein n=1 Tax=Meridianimarinicoccus zhengii TaxID=2056810 RepID=UPI0013A6AF75
MASPAPRDPVTGDALLPELTAQVFVATPEAQALVDGVRGALSMKNVDWQAVGTGIEDALVRYDDVDGLSRSAARAPLAGVDPYFQRL